MHQTRRHFFLHLCFIVGLLGAPLNAKECQSSLRSFVNDHQFLKGDIPNISTKELYLIIHGLAFESTPSLERQQFSRRFQLVFGFASAFLPQIPPVFLKTPPDPVRADRLILLEILRRGLPEERILILGEEDALGITYLDLLNDVSGIHSSRSIRRLTGSIVDIFEYQDFIGDISPPPLRFDEQGIHLMKRVNSWIHEFASGSLQENWMSLMEYPIINERFFEWVLGDLKLAGELWSLNDRRRAEKEKLREWLILNWKEINGTPLNPLYNPISQEVVRLPAYMYSGPY